MIIFTCASNNAGLKVGMAERLELQIFSPIVEYFIGTKIRRERPIFVAPA